MSFISVDRQHLKRYKAFNSNNHKVSSACHVGQESGAHCSVQFFDLLSTNDISLDKIEETFPAMRLR